jgi:hypothetical protein
LRFLIEVVFRDAIHLAYQPTPDRFNSSELSGDPEVYTAV